MVVYGEGVQRASEQASTAIGRTAEQLARANTESTERRVRQHEQVVQRRAAVRADSSRSEKAGWRRGGPQFAAAVSPALGRRTGLWSLGLMTELLASQGYAMTPEGHAALGQRLRQTAQPGEVLGGSRAAHTASRWGDDIHHVEARRPRRPKSDDA